MTPNIADRGVNLGGWFIPEEWMTPGLFDDLNVSDTAGLLQSPEGVRRYKEHIQEFIQESDIKELANNKVQLLRVPVAWWMIVDECAELADVCIERLDWLFRLVEKYDLKILLDYHAALGSQNGKDHSGKNGVIEWKEYRTENLVYISDIARRYANSPALWGIELLNEPVVKGNFWALFHYYRAAKKQLKSILPASVKIIIHDGFMPMLFANIAPWRSKTVLDMHLYEITVKDDESIQQYFDRRDKIYRRRIRLYKRFQPIIIGEWSGVIPAKFLNGLQPDEKAEIIRENISRQLALYRKAEAWMFWSYKTADTSMWNFQSLLQSHKELL
jgi:glucan 1,3-beta-glucosidase